MSRRLFIALAVLGLIIAFFVLVLTGVLPGLRPQVATGSATLTMWGVFDSSQAFSGAIAAYQKKAPNVRIIYRQFAPEDYERELVNALAAGTGPDIYMVHNTWLPKHFGKMTPLPADALPIATFQNIFPRVIAQDFAPDGVIYALPLYLDTLALLYNKDMFDNAGLALPPKTWSDVIALIPKLRKLDRTGKITRAAAAIGGSPVSINRATDLLSLIMMQSGTPMVAQDFRRAEFAAKGASALDFYTQFSDPKSLTYTWNDNLHYSLDAFAEGSVAMLFNYAYNIQALKDKNPFLPVGIAAMPQPSGATQRLDYPNYFGLTVAVKSRYPVTAWDFIKFFTTEESNIKSYLAATKHPPALRTLIAASVDDPDVGVFARQALTARSYPQIDNNEVDRAMGGLIQNVIYGKLDKQRALQQAEDALTGLIQARVR